MPTKSTSEDTDETYKSTYERSYYNQNKARILEQRRTNRKLYMRNYRLICKIKRDLGRK